MKTPKILNLLGLAVALAVFMILMAQVRYDRRYNRCFADSERMYRVEDNTENQGYSHWISDSEITDYLDSLDEVESVCQFATNYVDYNFKLEHPVEGVGGLSSITLYDMLFFDFFGYQCVDGTFSELDDDEEVVVPASLAKKLFPKESAVGKTLSLQDSYRGRDTILNRKIVAVYQDMPENNSFGNPLIFITMPYWDYKVVKIDQDSIQALWDGPEKCYAEVFDIEGKEDSLFATVHLFTEMPDMMSATNYESIEPAKDKLLKIKVSCDSAHPAPILAECVRKEPKPWGAIYCKLKLGTNPDTLAAMLKDKFYTEKIWESAPSDVVRLVAAKDIHFETDATGFSNLDAVSRFVVNCLAGIAWVVLIIAFLNFANFAIAEAPLRMRRMNTRKVLGESDGGIWWSMAKGYVTISLVAFLIAFLVFLLCTRLPEIPMLTNPVTLSGNLSIILTTLLLSIVVGVVVSIYPTRMVTVVSPDVALKGSYGFSKTGRRLRTLFIGLQFFLASVILTCTLYVAVQNRYLKTYDMGYQTHNILNYTADIRWTDSIPSYIHAVKQLPDVEDITAASYNIVRNSGYVLFGRRLYSPDGKDTCDIEFNAMSVYPNFMEFFGLKMVDGSTFKNCDISSETQRYVIFNKKLQDVYHLNIDSYYKPLLADSTNRLDASQLGSSWSMKGFWGTSSQTTLIGIAEDFHFRPLFDTIQPLGIEVGKYGQVLCQFFIKYKENADTAVLIREIRRITSEYGYETDLEISTLDDDIAGFYEKEAGLSKGLFILCGIAVLLALMGVAGMLLLEMTYRRPELGLRQIFGSSTGQLLARANGKYALVCTVAFLLSVPVSLLLIRQWLKLFVCHAPIAVWLFVIAYLILLALTVLVVTVQSALSLRFEPVDTVRT
ncbi:MAG: ABC transporter permease [Bacteroidales bacterium]|nr:ABC transporter permease [Bacteroidales bacterium]